MSNLAMEVFLMLGQTIEKVVPVTIALALIFSVLAHFWACNDAAPWWRKRELVTDIVYWFFVPVFARVIRIGLLVSGCVLVVGLTAVLTPGGRHYFDNSSLLPLAYGRNLLIVLAIVWTAIAVAIVAVSRRRPGGPVRAESETIDPPKSVE